MRATTSQQQIAITLHVPRRPGFYEVWLLAGDGVSMISLGDLNTGQAPSPARPGPRRGASR